MASLFEKLRLYRKVYALAGHSAQGRDSVGYLTVRGRRVHMRSLEDASAWLLGTSITVLLAIHWEPALRYQPRSLLLLVAKWGFFMLTLQWALGPRRGQPPSARLLAGLARRFGLCFAKCAVAAAANVLFLFLLHAAFGHLP